MNRGKAPGLFLMMAGVVGCSFQDHAARVISGREFDWTSCACVQKGMAGTDVQTILGALPYSVNAAGSDQELRFWAVLQRSSTDRFIGIPFEFKANPFEVECLIVLHDDRVVTVNADGIWLSCEESYWAHGRGAARGSGSQTPSDTVLERTDVPPKKWTRG